MMISDLSPKVSVIVPVYNAEAYLKDCIYSILRQTLDDIEVILVDDGSPDGSPAICDEFSRGDSRVRVIHKHNEGPAIARNIGLGNARGQWICFVDSDDCIAPETLSVCVDVAERMSADQVRFRFKRFPADMPVPSVKYKAEESAVMLLTEFPAKAMPIIEAVSNVDFGSGIVTTGSACTAIFNRQSLIGSGVRFRSEKETLYEDYIFNIEYAANCGTIVYLPYVFYYYRTTPNSRSKFRPDKLERASQLAKFMNVRLPELGYHQAGLVSTSVMLGNLRSYFRDIFASNYSYAEKKKLHYEAARFPYLMELKRDGYYRQLPLLPRLAFACRKSYMLTYMLTAGRDWMKRMMRR